MEERFLQFELQREHDMTKINVIPRIEKVLTNTHELTCGLQNKVLSAEALQRRLDV